MKRTNPIDILFRDISETDLVMWAFNAISIINNHNRRHKTNYTDAIEWLIYIGNRLADNRNIGALLQELSKGMGIEHIRGCFDEMSSVIDKNETMYMGDFDKITFAMDVAINLQAA